MRDLDWLAQIIVPHHAQQRIRERIGELDIDVVRGEIRSGILAGRVTGKRPNWTRGGTDDPAAAKGNCSYVWDKPPTRCWVVHTGGSERIVVKTVLLSTDAENRVAAGRLLRSGTRRA